MTNIWRQMLVSRYFKCKEWDKSWQLFFSFFFFLRPLLRIRTLACVSRSPPAPPAPPSAFRLVIPNPDDCLSWQMTHSLGATPLQTNKSTAPANGVLVDISPCQSAPSSGSPFRCVRARNQCVIISTLSSLFFFFCFFAEDMGRWWEWWWWWGCRRGIDMTRSAQGGHKYIQIIFCLLFRRFSRRVLAPNLCRSHSTEATHFQSARFVSQRQRSAPRSSRRGLIEWMYVPPALPPLSRLCCCCWHLLATAEGKNKKLNPLRCAPSQQRESMVSKRCKTTPRDSSWSKC